MIRMIGGEMPEYAEEHPPAGGVLLRHLLDRLPTGIRVLVAGPHDTGLIGALAERRDVTCLIRSQPDAATIPDVTVLCGTLSKLTDADRYDMVIALDGVGRLCSPEDTPLDWAESVRVLARSLRPGGTLLLTVENELGVHRLVDPGTPTAARSADAWRPLGEYGGTPGRPDRLAAALAAEGLPVAALATAWPLPVSPTLLVTPETLGRGPLDALAALAAAAVSPAYAGRSVLSDPRRLAASAVRRGVGAELAPAWLVVAQRATRPGPAVVPLPPALFTGPSGAVTEVVGTPDHGWLRRVVRGWSPALSPAPGDDTEHQPGPSMTDRQTEPLPGGRLLEERLLTAALGHDLPRLRRLLTGWMTELPMAAAGNVLVDGDRYALLDPAVPDQPDALARFAHTLLDGGYHHPWPGVTDPARLIAVLAGAAGLDTVPETAAADGPPGRREQEAQLDALRQRLADAEERCRFFEIELEKREAELGRAKTQIAAFSGNLGYRAAKAGLVLARAARNRIRKGRS
ncbi:hypothetical protein Aph02nite_70700 [Actinoplanes philippinensis]|uniref:Methyltransferase domain-containing protein n=1 Tax=Actinoplanes philippinensis TaxID=35752 RepID=A0A1I2JZP5_9ACTN|nr:hypothetical protein [Actinoplanes philippinensis]GIE81120.1 hypothetical protein Aph02nite_70700 [Actinoplanes philippinensis]SFF60044.1 hypothetical protein SAMN05421541_114242 [Actinoplanes philippinensis]